MAAEDQFLTLREVARYLRVHERTIYNWAQAGIIPAAKLGGAWRFRKSEIDAWVETRKNSRSLRRGRSRRTVSGRTRAK